MEDKEKMREEFMEMKKGDVKFLINFHKLYKQMYTWVFCIPIAFILAEYVTYLNRSFEATIGFYFAHLMWIVFVIYFYKDWKTDSQETEDKITIMVLEL